MFNKYQDALETIAKSVKTHEISTDVEVSGYGQELSYIQELVDRSIPMKPDAVNGYEYVCPKCNHSVCDGDKYFIKDKFCSDCGQAIDWSEDL